jgi:hypothetical protein
MPEPAKLQQGEGTAMEITCPAHSAERRIKRQTSDATYLVEFVDLPDTFIESATQE